MTDETVVLQADNILKWNAPKRKQTVFGAVHGRLVVTTRRLVFLSSGKGDPTLVKGVVGTFGPLGKLLSAPLGRSSKSELDPSAVGGVDVALERVTSAELTKSGFVKALTVRWTDPDGVEHVATFAHKDVGIPDGPAWVAAIKGESG